MHGRGHPGGNTHFSIGDRHARHHRRREAAGGSQTTRTVAREAKFRRRRAWTMQEWEQQPEVEWLIEGIIPKRSLVILAGPSGHGKSFIALDQSLAVATGGKWLREWQCAKGNVFYVVAEGQAGLKARWRAWAEFNKQPLPPNWKLLPDPYFIQRGDEARSSAGASTRRDSSPISSSSTPSTRCSRGTRRKEQTSVRSPRRSTSSAWTTTARSKSYTTRDGAKTAGSEDTAR